MKTRIEILESFHDQANTKLLEAEINLRTAEKRSILMKPGTDYDGMQKEIVKFKEMIKAFKAVIITIDEFIKEEK